MASLLDQRGSIDQESEMLPQDPPPFIMRSLAWMLVGAFIFAFFLDLVNRMDRLAKQGGVSEVDLVKIKLDLAESEKDFSVAQRTQQQIALDEKRMETSRARQRGEELAEIEKTKLHVAALKADLENTQGSMLTVRSPYDGVVTSVEQRNAGSVVQQGQILCQLSQINARPIAKM